MHTDNWKHLDNLYEIGKFNSMLIILKSKYKLCGFK